MEKLKSIAPEILGLFETIQKQSKEYGDAFERFEQVNRDYEKIIAKLSSMSVTIKEETEKAITNANTNVLESLIILKNKTDETFKLGFDLKNIKSVITKLENLEFSLNDISQKAKKQYEEMESAVSLFKKKSDLELESTISNVKSKIEKDIQAEGQKIELRFSLRLKMYETRLRDLETDFKRFEDGVSAILKKFGMDIEMLKGDGSGFGSDFSVGGSYHSIQALSERVDSLSNNIDNAGEDDRFHNQRIGDLIKEEFEEKIKPLYENIDSLNKEIDEAKNKKTTTIPPAAALGTALVALLLAVGAVVVALFK